MKDPTEQIFMGVSEIAAYTGVSRQAVCNWDNRGKLPEPVVRLRMGPIWLTEEIVTWFNR